MDSEKIRSILKEAVEAKLPGHQIDMWAGVQERLVAGNQDFDQQGARMNRTRRRQLPRLALIALTMVALTAFTLITPQGRAIAQEMLQFFRRAESHTFPLAPSQIPVGESDPSEPTAQPPASMISIRDAEMQAGFDAAELPFVPEGFEYLGARVYGKAIHLEYGVPGGGGNLMITQSKDGFNQSDWDKVPAEAIVPVKIRDLDGEFAQGSFIVPAGETSAVWNPDAPILRLRWVKDGIWFEMAKYGDVERIEYLDQSGMITLAESLIYPP